MRDLGADRQPGEGGPTETQIRTFLIADVRGYTLFTQERGDEAAAKLAAKFADLAREIVEARGGTLLELRGDEALCVFASAREALRTAVDLQQRFVQETLDQPELPLTVGIGLDAGEAVPVQGGYRGAALNLAARLCGQARAGEILATREVTHLAGRIEGARYQDRGSLTFKGIADPVVVVTVVPEGEDPAERLKPFAPAPAEPPKAGSRRWVIVGAIGAVLALIAISIPLLGSDGGPTELQIETNSLARIGGDGNLELSAPLGQRPGASAIGFGSLWVAQPDRGRVARLDLEDGKITDTIPVGASPAGIATGDGAVWVANSGDGTVSRVNVETNEATQVLDAGTGPTGVAFGDGVLWVADTLGARLLRIDPATGDAREVGLAGQPSSVAFTQDGVWVALAPAGITRVDPSDTGVTFTKPVGNGPTVVLSAFDSIWVANHLDGTVTRLDPTTGDVRATIPVQEGPNALAAVGDALWVANEFDDSISAIDPTTDSRSQTIPVGASATSLVNDGDALWIAVGASASEHRGGTLVVSTSEKPPKTLDPAFAFIDSMPGPLLAITNDALLTFKKVGGPDGTTLVPDLASALPEVSPDGLTYRFPLREGVSYSTGEPVRPEDFRNALERSYSLEPDAAGYHFAALEGADACYEKPRTCDLSSAVLVEEGAVTFRLATPDPDLPFKLAQPPAYPVPASVPIEDQGLDGVPATGPYMISAADGDGIELVRNPEFAERSAAAQPDGFVDRISYRFEEDPSTAFEEMEADAVDVMIPTSQDIARLEATNPEQIMRWTNPSALYLGFDTRVPPFDDAAVRQALNYAVDRDHVVELTGGPTVQRATCQMFPPNFQGYEPFCPYTLGPESGVWSAPDLERAEQLIEEAGVAGEPVTMWVFDFAIFTGSLEVMGYVRDLLTDLGFDPTLKVVGNVDRYFQGARGGGPQLYLGGWLATPPSAATWLDPDLRCGFASSAPVTCTEEVETAIEEALSLQATDPAAATQAWTEIEHGLVEDAAWVPLTNLATTVAVSARTENVQVHTQWGILLSRVWVQ